MGLLDSVLGGTPANSGLSAATKALLVVLAAKAAQDYFTHRQQAPQGAGSAPNAGGLGGVLGGMLGGGASAGTPQGAGAPTTGGLGGILGSVLGGGASGGAPGGLGSILGGGGGLGGLLGGLGGAGALGGLISQFQQAGHGDTVKSWVGAGANQPIAPDQLEQILGPGPLGELEARTGMPRQAILQQLAHELPTAMDQITPQGRLPTDDELAAPAGA